MADNEQIGTWPSGYDWQETGRFSSFFFLQGEVFYFVLLLFPFPFLTTLKVLGVVLVLAVIAKLLGVRFKGVFQRLKQFIIGNNRAVYSGRSNFLRMRLNG
ncbi:MAG: hypothetical protein ACJAS1_005734 [Oleiphilaceae bacterium]|jgi:hypothetical protein